MAKILHAFADSGVESEALSVYGEVTRATIDPRKNPLTHTIKADLSDPDQVPFKRNEFKLALLHPPCTPYADMPGANKDGNAPELIPEAREIGQRYAEHYVVENKPAAPLNDPVTLDGSMFGLPVKFERAFETSFQMEQPPRYVGLNETETSPFFYSERSPEWWRAAKGGISGDYPKEHIAKNCLPLPFVHHICRAWLDATRQSDGVADYSDYDAQMDARRAKAANASLGEFQ